MKLSGLRVSVRTQAICAKTLCLLAAGSWVIGYWAAAPVQATPLPSPPNDAHAIRTSSPLARLLKTEHVSWLHLQPLGQTRTGRPLFALIVGHPAHSRADAKGSRLVVLLSPALDHSGRAVRTLATQIIRQWSRTPALRRRHRMQRVLLVFFLGRGYRPVPQPHADFGWPADLPKPSSTHPQNLLLAMTPTTRAWLTLFEHWHPALVTEMVTRHSAAWRDSFLFGGTPTKLLAPGLATLATRLVADARTSWSHAHLAVGLWMQPRNPENPGAGVETVSASPAHIIGYSALANILAVQWVFNPHVALRVETREIAKMGSAWISVLARAAKPLLETEHQLAIEARYHYPAFRTRFSVHDVLKRSPDAFLLRTYAYSETLSPISGTIWVRYDRNMPRNYLVPRYSRLEGLDPLPDIAGYVIPAGFSSAVEILRMHGIQIQDISSPVKLRVGTERLSHIRWQRTRHNALPVIASFDTVAETREFVYPPGSVFIPVNQRLARIVVLLLDPQSPFSLFRLGYFNSIFNPLPIHPQSALETLARTLLRKHPRLARRFVARIMHPAFAENPTARLDFFYRYVFRDPVSPDLYPVGTLRHAPLHLGRSP